MRARRRLVYLVTVDGREIGPRYKSRLSALSAAEGYQSEAPWSVVEIFATWN